jgi:membrane protease YdiL (CAAX protease family)
MARLRETIYDIFAVFLMFFGTLILNVNFGIVQLYYPSLILWAAMPLIVELAVRRGSIGNLGFRKTNFKRGLPLIFGLIVMWLLAFGVVSQVRWQASLPARYLFFVASIFFHPGFVEELCFRGFLETRLERLFTVRQALVIQAVIFGLYHLPQTVSGNPGWLVVGGSFYPVFAFIFGLFLGAIYIKTRNLLVGIGLHASLLEFFLLISLLSS